MSLYCEKDNAELAPVVLFDPRYTGIGQELCRTEEMEVLLERVLPQADSDVVYGQSVQWLMRCRLLNPKHDITFLTTRNSWKSDF